MNWFPEPHELADAWIAAQDEARERELASGSCGTCGNYTAAPKEWAHIDFGWCCKCDDWTEADYPARDCESDYMAVA